MHLEGSATATVDTNPSFGTNADEDHSPMSMDASPPLLPHPTDGPVRSPIDGSLRNFSSTFPIGADSYGTSEDNSPLPHPPRNVDNNGLHFAGQRLGSLSCFFGIPIFSEDGRRWVRGRTGDDFAFVPDHLHTLVFQDSQLSNTTTAPAEDYLLPDRQKVARYITAYQNSPLADVFPIIVPDEFQHTIATAYGETQEPTWKVNVARFDVCSVTTFFAAIIGHVLKLETSLNDLAGLARAAWSYGSRCSSYPATVEALQGFFALVLPLRNIFLFFIL